ncbi:MAG TPA: alkaline phosphatase family protein [Vicinamibacterales bacterium]|nr:alkaline phosphatase family protein [Vicinamibacterales bacterium]
MRIRKSIAVAMVAAMTQPAFIGAASKDHEPKQKYDSMQDRPIKHLVVIFDENISFDHYFATYPTAKNPAGEPAFTPLPDTPGVNGLSGALLTNNPNKLNAANGAGAVNPFRLDRSQAWTASQNHNYMPEQAAIDKGAMDLFPAKVGTPDGGAMVPAGVTATTGITMGYYDGNTVTAMWNYAQRFAMSDNSYDTGFGPSTPGALNLVSGQTNGVLNHANGTGNEVNGSDNSLTVFGDADPYMDVCSGSTTNQVEMKGKNIGDLLSASGITWGWFQGGFDLTRKNANGTTGCLRSTPSPVIASVSPTSATQVDYVPHHAPFQYYASTRNPQHLRPSSVHTIGQDGDRGNHNYDIQDFYDAVSAGNFPTVSFLKAAKYQNGHASNSTPLDEQAWIVHVVNFLQQRPEWCDTAVVIAYDDSDGWYDHQLGPIVNHSTSAQDALTSPVDATTGVGQCGTDGPTTALAGPDGVAHAQGRCGYGPRLPLLVISPWSKRNFVDHTVTDQSSVIQFIEDYWLHGQRIGDGSYDAIANSIDGMLDLEPEHGQFDRGNRCEAPDLLFLDESTGEPTKRPHR